MVRLVSVLALVGLALRLYLLSQPLDSLDGLTLPDDTYYLLEVAKSVGQGRGLVCGDTPTSGIQPLFVLLAAPLYIGSEGTDVAELDELARGALWIPVVFDVLLLAVALLTLARLGARLGLVFFAATWAVGPPFLWNALNGMETSIAAALLLLVVHLFAFHPRARFLLGLVLGLAVLARIDLAAVGGWIGLTLLWRAWKGQETPRGTVLALLSIGLGFALVYGPWLVYLYSQTGDIYPTSGAANRVISEGVPVGLALRNGLVVIFMVRVVSVAFVLAVASMAPPHRAKLLPLLRRLSPLVAFAGFAFLAYTLYLRIPWFQARYLFPVSIALLLCGAMAVDILFTSLPARLAPWITLACALLPSLVDPRLRLLFAGGPTPGYRDSALWARNFFHAGTVIGSRPSGAITYYAQPGVTVVNLDGVVDADALDAIHSGELGVYLKSRGVNHVIGWDLNHADTLQHIGSGARLVYDSEAGISTWEAPLPGEVHPWQIYRVE
jgi:hypothetical protein